MGLIEISFKLLYEFVIAHLGLYARDYGRLKLENGILIKLKIDIILKYILFLVKKKSFNLKYKKLNGFED